MKKNEIGNEYFEGDVREMIFDIGLIIQTEFEKEKEQEREQKIILKIELAKEIEMRREKENELKMQIEKGDKKKLKNKLKKDKEKAKEKKKKAEINFIMISDTAEGLYNDCVCEDLPDPATWIYNQDKMRRMWSSFKEHNTKYKKKNIVNDILDNSYAKYMNFMYDTYPIGFGNEMQKCFREKKSMDCVETFQILKKNDNNNL